MDRTRMPVVFVGHGSPMNAIEDNAWSRTWKELGRTLPRPECILAISAHWMTRGQKIRNASDNRQIYDMYGFPQELYDVEYAPAGEPIVAKQVKELLSSEAAFDDSWGIDHGIWSVLVSMFPQADVPVVMMSTDLAADPRELYRRGTALRSLREAGVLILVSGNVVHNLALVDYSMEHGGFPWAHEFDAFIKDAILRNDTDSVVDYRSLNHASRQAVRTPEHFYPLLYALGASDSTDEVEVWNEDLCLGALSMTSYTFG